MTSTSPLFQKSVFSAIQGLGDFLRILPLTRARPPYTIWMVAFHQISIGFLNFFGCGFRTDAQDFMRSAVQPQTFKKKLLFFLRSSAWRSRVPRLISTKSRLRRFASSPIPKSKYERTHSELPQKKEPLRFLWRKHQPTPLHPSSISQGSFRLQSFLKPLYQAVLITLMTVNSAQGDSFIEERICPSSLFASRTGTQLCWARYSLSGTNQVCVPRSVWTSWLREGSPDLSRCFRASGTWKSRAFLQNDLSSNHLKKIDSVFQVKEITNWEKISLSPTRAIERLREKASWTLAPNDPWGIARQLIINESQSQGPGAVLRLLGFVHLLSATGIHLYAIARIWDHLLGFAVLQSPLPISTALALKRIVVGVLWLMAWLLSGARIGMLRPLLLISSRWISDALGFRWRNGSPLFLALFFDFLIGFLRGANQSWGTRIFYALAVGGGMMALNRKDKVWQQHIALAVGSWAFAGVWEAWHAGHLAVATPLISWVTLPLVSLFIYPTLLFGILSGFHAPLQWSSDLLTVAVKYLCALSLKTPNLWVVPHWALLFGSASTAFILIFARYSPKRPSIYFPFSFHVTFIALAVTGSVRLLLLPRLEQRKPSVVEQLDVGQGDAALIQVGTRGLIDSGSAHALSDASWIQLLSQRGITHLDWVALSHLDEDHAGGVIRLARLLPIRCVASAHAQWQSVRGLALKNSLKEAGIRVVEWNEPCFPFDVYSPPEQKSSKKNSNMSAFAVPISKNTIYLSAGDASTSDEIKIANWMEKRERLRSFEHRILKISHHGSRTSSDPDFLTPLKPTEAWISVGVGNRYHHPTMEALARIHALHIPVHRTDLEGRLMAGSRSE